MKNQITIENEELLVIVDKDFNIEETHVYIPLFSGWHEMTNEKVQKAAEKLVQDYIEENNINLNNDCDDLGSSNYRRFVSNF